MDVMTEPALFDPANLQDPYPMWEAYRSHGDLIYIEEWDAWIVLSADIARNLLRSRSIGGRDFRKQRSAFISEDIRPHLDDLMTIVELQMVFLDSPDHGRVRRGLQAAFTPATIEKLRPRVRRLVNELIDAAPGGGLDWVNDVARPLPAIVICEILGIPLDDLDRFVGWSDELITFVGRRDGDEEYLLGTQASLKEWAVYFRSLAESHENSDTVLGRLLVAKEQEGLSWNDLIANALFILTAGHETTTNLMGNGLLALLRNPDQLQWLHNDSSLLEGAVEELLRVDPSVQMIGRVALKDINVAGKTIKADTDVHFSVAAINRDPAAFPNPQTLNIRREVNRHLSFGMGPHHCLGAALARMEGQEAFRAVLDRFRSIKLDGPVSFHPNPRFRGLKSLQLAVE